LSVAALFLLLLLGVFEPVAFSVSFDDVYAVRESLEQCTCEPLVVTPQV